MAGPRRKSACLKRDTERTSAYLVLAARGPAISSPNGQGTDGPLPSGENASRVCSAPTLKQCPSAQLLSTGCSPERPAPSGGPSSVCPPAHGCYCSLEIHSLGAGRAGPPQGWKDFVPSLLTCCSLRVRTLPQLHRSPPPPNSVPAAAARRPSELTISRPKG